ncbi:MAG: hypothetical protein HYV65_01985 [Candidatus Spechtbacteria bacterium]|nr:hypothetical protein [Candidatus Spechtbacteria bacterium]
MIPSQKIQIKPVVERIMRSLPERNRDIIASRFGIGKEGHETLESIGRRYRVTRERVRQIEEASLVKLTTCYDYQILEPYFEKIAAFIDERGGMAQEQELLRDLVPSAQSAHLRLALNLSDAFTSIAETDDFHPMWATNKMSADQLQSILLRVASYLHQERIPMAWGNLLEIAKKEAAKTAPDFSADVIARHIAVAKNIKKGPFEKYGLAHWPEISPRGMRDKAYLVLEESAKTPLHFREIAKLIDSLAYFKNLNSRHAHPQTVHNELIKDGRFVLVGRGTYGLVKWGYKPGIVRDVMVSTLKESGPMTKEELTASVLKQRMVQENTILLNMQNKKYFRRTSDGRYTVA